mmetsp:Transcript_6657/g.13398  ORF Transcript_6657/g.13398 Transcript_6657/m.13398 type:complete len:258 (-) Transcript_6657:346-1119(-)
MLSLLWRRHRRDRAVFPLRRTLKLWNPPSKRIQRHARQPPLQAVTPRILLQRNLLRFCTHQVVNKVAFELVAREMLLHVLFDLGAHRLRQLLERLNANHFRIRQERAIIIEKNCILRRQLERLERRLHLLLGRGHDNSGRFRESQFFGNCVSCSYQSLKSIFDVVSLVRKQLGTVVSFQDLIGILNIRGEADLASMMPFLLVLHGDYNPFAKAGRVLHNLWSPGVDHGVETGNAFLDLLVGRTDAWADNFLVQATHN